MSITTNMRNNRMFQRNKPTALLPSADIQPGWFITLLPAVSVADPQPALGKARDGEDHQGGLVRQGDLPSFSLLCHVDVLKTSMWLFRICHLCTDRMPAAAASWPGGEQ
jgi:hypothetical protein